MGHDHKLCHDHCDSHGHSHDHEGETWQSGAIFAACTLLLGVAAWAIEKQSPTAGFVLFLGAYIAGLWHPIQEAAEKLAHLEIDVDLLMILVAVGAWLLGQPVEGAALLVLFNAGHAMEAFARARTHSALGDLMAELPETVLRLDGEDEHPIPLAEIVVGDRLRIRPGDRVPVDSQIIEGVTTIDLSAITGESAPLPSRPGQQIPSGALNRDGVLTVEALRPPTESAYQKIVRIVEDAPARKSPAQQLSESVGRWFTMAILLVSISAFLVWWLAMGLEVKVAAYRAMVLLVAGSPCAIVLSIPSAVLAAISAGARGGILFNGGIGLGALARVRHVAFDKTGTLSTGEPGVVRVLWNSDNRDEDLSLAFALARTSTHPASEAVRCHVQENAPALVTNTPHLTEIREAPGVGMQGIWNGETVELGRDYQRGESADDEAHLGRVVLRRNGIVRARFLLSENARPGAAATTRALREAGVAPLILSGDTQSAVDRMAAEVGIADARGELRPEAKWQVIRDLAEKGGVAMVGDGINDVPALSAATVGVAMGIRGSAAALAQADVVLVKDRLEDLTGAFQLSRRCQTIVNQNLAIAIGAAAILVLFALIGELPLALGVFGHEGGTVLVVLNSLRLLGGNGARSGALRPSADAVSA
ncbi:cadmium-translocating P-type ATPase [bacterium]|nr:cadmium-translocating P-type ATPase [bacterium]